MNGPKPGHKTTELLLVVVVLLLIAFRDRIGANLEDFEAIAAMIGSGLYAVSRGIVKMNGHGTGNGGGGGAGGAAASIALLVVGGSLLLAKPASAGSYGFQVGENADWVRYPGSSGYEAVQSPLGGIAADVVIDPDGYWGFSVLTRLTEDQLAGRINEYGFDFWGLWFDGALETFGGPRLSDWPADLTGTAEQLYGGRMGIRFDFEGMPFEVSYAQKWGADGLAQRGFFFGIRPTVLTGATAEAELSRRTTRSGWEGRPGAILALSEQRRREVIEEALATVRAGPRELALR